MPKRAFTLLPAKRRRLGRGVIALLTLLALSCLCLFYFSHRLSPVLHALAEERAGALATHAVNEALLEVLGQESGSLVEYSYDERGRLTLLTCDTAAANRVRALAGEAVLAALEDAEYAVISVPVGSLTDSVLLAGRGPKISARVVPLSSAEVTLSDSFTSAGINQTLFTLSAEIRVSVGLISPLRRESTELFLTCPLTQIILSGDVPEVYVGASA